MPPALTVGPASATPAPPDTTSSATFTLGLAEVTDTPIGEPVAPGLGAKLISSSPTQAAECVRVGVGETVGVGVGVGGGATTSGR